MTVCCGFRSLGWPSVAFLESVAEWTLVCAGPQATAGLEELGICWLSQPWHTGYDPAGTLLQESGSRVYFRGSCLGSSQNKHFEKMKAFPITKQKNLLQHRLQLTLEIWQGHVCPPSQVRHPLYLRFSSSIIPDTIYSRYISSPEPS